MNKYDMNISNRENILNIAGSDSELIADLIIICGKYPTIDTRNAFGNDAPLMWMTNTLNTTQGFKLLWSKVCEKSVDKLAIIIRCDQLGLIDVDGFLTTVLSSTPMDDVNFDFEIMNEKIKEKIDGFLALVPGTKTNLQKLLIKQEIRDNYIEAFNSQLAKLNNIPRNNNSLKGILTKAEAEEFINKTGVSYTVVLVDDDNIDKAFFFTDDNSIVNDFLTSRFYTVTTEGCGFQKFNIIVDHYKDIPLLTSIYELAFFLSNQAVPIKKD